MSEQKPQPSAFLRWTIWLFISMAMFGNYYIYDSISPLADLLKAQLGYSDANIGLLQAIYSFPNIIMVLIGGLIIDRIGTRKSVIIFTFFVMAGSLVTAAWGNIYSMSAGRLLFGLGAESMIVAITTIIARWFKGKELSFAFGLNLTIARLGSFLALNSPTWGKSFYNNWQWPLWVTVAAGAIAVSCILIYSFLDVFSAKRYEMPKEGSQDKIEFKEIFSFNRSFWFITALCVTFYSAMFPFQTFAVKFFIDRHFTMVPNGAGRAMGGFLSSLLTLSAMILTPLFGLLADKIGKRSLLMMFGSLIIIPVYLVMNYSNSSSTPTDNDLTAIDARSEILRDSLDEFNFRLSSFDDAFKQSHTSNQYIDSVTQYYCGADTSRALNLTKPAEDIDARIVLVRTAIEQKFKSSLETYIASNNLSDRFRIEYADAQFSVKEIRPLSFGENVNIFLAMISFLLRYFPLLVIPMMVMGVAFSLVPAVLWPSVALIVEDKKLGTAYGLMTMIQNIGLFSFNLLIGLSNDVFAAGKSNPSGYSGGMWMFSTLGFFAVIFTLYLKRSNKTLLGTPGVHDLEKGTSSK